MLDTVLRHLDIGMPRNHGPIDLATAMALCHTPGVGIALILDGAVAETRYAGVREIGGAPVDEHTLFQAGSVAKSVAAACALRLVADGVLGLDDDVNAGLRSWRVPANDGWQPVVTLRQLLGHTAATTAGGYIGYPRGAHVPTVPEILDGLGNSEAVVVTGLPGLRYGYSGGGYLVAQQLCVDVTGTDFATLAKLLVLDPAGMIDSTFAQPLPDALANNAACGHHPGPVIVPGRWHTYPEMAAGGLWTTATDLARFFLAIRAGLTGAPGALLPRSVTEEMATPLTDIPYGLGLVVAPPGEPARIANFGNDQGFENHATVQVESGQGLVVTTNSFYGKELINYVLLPAVRRELGWPGGQTVIESGEAVPGRYGDIGIERDGDDLLLSYPAQPPVRLVHDGGRWRARVINLDAWFEDGTLLIDQSGSVTRHQPA